MIITTAKKSILDTSKPAQSPVITVLDDRGNKVLDVLTLTGVTEEVTEFMETVTMVEVDGTYGKEMVHEDFLWQ